MESPSELASLILRRVDGDAAALRSDFHRPRPIPTNYTIVDDLLPMAMAHRIHDAFPPVAAMRRLSSRREQKYTSKSLDDFDPLLTSIVFAFQDVRVVERIARLTDLRDVRADPDLYAGGISTMLAEDFLLPHIDNSHDRHQGLHRVLNLLYYVTPDWSEANGGGLELWDHETMERVEIAARFNRLVIMSTNDRSWHSVNTVIGPGARTCVSNYYYSPHPPGSRRTSHVTYFRGRPGRPVEQILMKVDGEFRTAIRRVKRRGLARSDVYDGSGRPGQSE